MLIHMKNFKNLQKMEGIIIFRSDPPPDPPDPKPPTLPPKP